MACDPAVLIDQAKCINACIPKGMMPSVNLALLCQIANTGGAASFPVAGLIHYWKMEEASGSNRVDSIGASNLSENLAAVGSGAGIHANAASFTGVSYLENAAFVTSVPWSFALWAKCPSFVGGLDVAEITAGALSVFFTLTAAGNLEVGNGTDGTLFTPVFGAINTWHLIVLTILANGTYSLSIDNSAFAVVVATPPGPSTKIQFGTSDTVGGNKFTGLQDEAAIWSRAITQSEVNTLWNGGVGTFL